MTDLFIPGGILRLEGGTLTGTMTAHLWCIWGQAAIEREVEAWVARQAGDIGHELRASLQAVCASAVSLDNLVHAIDGLVGRTRPSGPRSTFGAWIRTPYQELRRWRSRRKRRPRRVDHVLEALNREFQLGPLIGSGELNRRVRPLFRARTLGLHHQEGPREIVPHPSGTSTTALAVDDYSAEKASEAVDTLLWVLETCIQNPRETTRTWVTPAKALLDASLIQFRRQLKT